MTAKEAYIAAKRRLSDAGNDAAAFDAAALCEKFLGMTRADVLLHPECPVEAGQAAALLSAADLRANGEPLQYLLGHWPFLDLDLKVGRVVLCPREETELLVRTAAARLPRNARVLDLCAGTGAVGLGLCSLRPDVRVLCGEKEEAALSYLFKNCEAYPDFQVTPLKLDAFLKSDAQRVGALDGFLSNPPYIERAELSHLQAEVRREPRAALDGGEDGLAFYRAIASIWLPHLLPGGFAAVEIGESQGAAVRALFSEAGLQKVEILLDFSNLPRVVCGVKSE